MPLKFEATKGYSVDVENDIKIYNSRMQLGRVPDEAEYQYVIDHHDASHYFGCLGLCVRTEERGQPLQLFTLDLGSNATVERILSLKKSLGVQDNTLEFFKSLADGLVKVYQYRTDNREPVRYVALAQRESFIRIGFERPRDVAELPDGQLILAEALVPAHPIVGIIL